MIYDYFIVDAVNFAYRTFDINKEEHPEMVGKKSIYKKYACNFIMSLENLKKKYLHSDGTIFLLFDNYFSRADFQTTFNYADRKKIDEAYKATRKKENKQFYNTLNFLRYFYMIGSDNVYTVRIDNLEADDLVKPTLDAFVGKGKKTLLITTDLDWCRYIGDGVDWLPSFKNPPEDYSEVSEKLGFKINAVNIIAYKSIFGDPSDNIKSLVSKKFAKDFCHIAPLLEYPEQLLLFARNPDYNEKYSFLKDILQVERQYLINVQLISAIECSLDIFKEAATQGRKDETLHKSLREVIGLDSPKNTFVFGNIKRPRA